MSNVDRAADFIARAWPNGRGIKTDDATVLAEELSAAGFITPDLPRPDRDGRWWPAAVSISNVSINPAGEVVLHSGNFRDMQLHLTPEKANDLADILKAAARHATQEKTP